MMVRLIHATKIVAISKVRSWIQSQIRSVVYIKFDDHGQLETPILDEIRTLAQGEAKLH